MANLFIHIGMGKTGTSAIQRMLAESFDVLQRKGYFYVGLVFERLSTMDSNPEAFLNGLSKKSVAEACRYLESLFDRSANYCQAHGQNNILWSWEALSSNFGNISNKVKTAARKHDVRIIVYLRRQDQWIESAYHQWGVVHRASNRPVLDFRDYLAEMLDTGRLDYYEVIRPWAEAFGKERITVRVYEQEQLPDGVCADFLGTIGIHQTEEFRFPDTPVYQSYHRNVYDLIKIYRRGSDNSQHPTRLMELLDNCLDPGERKKPYESFGILSPQERLDLLRQCDASNQKVAREYLGREDGRLFYAADPDPEAPFVPRPPLDREAMAKIFLQIFLYQDGQIRDLQERVDVMSASRKKTRRVFYVILMILVVWAAVVSLSIIVNR